jgi:rod shape-determining protein MreC
MNDKKNPGQQKNRFTLAVLTIVCVAMILLGIGEAFPVKAVRNVAGTILSPLQTGISRAGNWLASQQADARTVDELSAENDQLQKKVSYLEEQNTLLSENADELEQLRSLYKLDGDYSVYDKVAADVISKDPSRWYDVFTINKGTTSGIKTGMNVIADGGLVGLVIDTGATWAKVRSIIDDESRVSASVLDESGNCIVSGDLSLISEGKLRLSQLNADVNVSSGDRLVTSSISDRYLPGLLIGYVDSVEEDTNNLTKNGYVIPAVNFEQISDVFVILAQKDTGDTSGTTETPESSASQNGESVTGSSAGTNTDAAGAEG